jgi:hypothetical protein
MIRTSWNRMPLVWRFLVILLLPFVVLVAATSIIMERGLDARETMKADVSIILSPPPGATEMGRVELDGYRGLLRLNSFDYVTEVVWGSTWSRKALKDWYADQFLRSHHLESEGPPGRYRSTLVGRVPASNGEVILGISISSERPVVRDVEKQNLKPSPAGVQSYVTVRVVDLGP